MRRAVAGIAVLFIATSATAWAAGSAPSERGAKWLVSLQQSDGRFSANERADQTAETIAAIVAGGVTGAPVDKALNSLRTRGADGATRGAYTGKIIAGIVAGGGDPRAFGGHDFVSKLNSQYDTATGTYDSGNFFSDLLAVNGLNAAQQSLPHAAYAHITSGQCTDGGFAAINCSSSSDADTTAWAIDVLVASGHNNDPTVGRAKTFLRQTQKPDGGWAYTPSLKTSSDSTGLVISAINALGEDATKSPWLQSDGDNPVKALVALQLSSGAFRANKGVSNGNVMSTLNAVPGLAHQSYPIQAAGQTPYGTPVPTKKPGGPKITAAPGSTESAPASASVVVENGAAPPTSRPSSDGTTARSATDRSGSTPKREAHTRPTPYVLGFGGISTKPGGGLSLASWAAIAAGSAGLGVGLWFLRARLR